MNQEAVRAAAEPADTGRGDGVLIAALGPVAAVLLCCFCFQFAQGVLTPLVTVQLVGHRTGTGLIGAIGSAYFAGFIVGTLRCERVIDRVGHIRALSVYAVLAANATLLFAVTDPPWFWMASRLVLGYALAGIYVVVESWLNEKASSATRGRIFGVYQVVGWSTSGLAPLMLNLADPMGPSLMILAAAAFATALVPVALTRVGNPDIGQRNHFGMRRLIAISPLGVVACFASGLVSSAFFGLMPVYTHAQGLSTGELTVVLTAATIGGTLMAMPAGILADRLGRRPTMLGFIAVAVAAGAVAIGLDVSTLSIAVVLAFVFTVGAGPLYSLGVGQTNDHVMPRDFVAASGGLLCAWAVGASLGTIVASQAMALLGADGLFIYEVAVLVALGLFALYRMTRRPVPARPRTGGHP